MKEAMNSSTSFFMVVPLPPPINGESLACESLKKYLEAKKYVVTTLNTAKFSNQDGTLSIPRFIEVLKIISNVLVLKNVSITYMTLSESFLGNLKDIIVFSILRTKSKRVVCHLHGGAGLRELLKKKYSISWLACKFILSKLDYLILLGKSLALITNDAIPAKKIRICPNFYEPQLLIEKEKINRKFKDIHRKINLLFLSNLVEGKGIMELVAAFNCLTSHERSKLHLSIVGSIRSENLGNKILSLVRSLENCTFYGALQGEEKIEILHKSHVFCLPSYYKYEGQPISILEAYAAGCAVISTDHSGIQDIFQHNKNGIRVEKKSIISLVNALRELIKTPQHIKQYGVYNREYALKYSKESHVEKILEIFFSDLKTSTTYNEK
jgi:glycosyltransferase involved in cell wall biosynthesis